jgi:hypothetical protein
VGSGDAQEAVEDDEGAVGRVPVRGRVGVVGELDGSHVWEGRVGRMPSLRDAGQPSGRGDRAETLLEATGAAWRRAGRWPKERGNRASMMCCNLYLDRSMPDCRGKRDSTSVCSS